MREWGEGERENGAEKGRRRGKGRQGGGSGQLREQERKAEGHYKDIRRTRGGGSTPLWGGILKIRINNEHIVI